ncbi:DNA phosphorothioation system sulfurtransferase DndC [Alienimonas californiensis]
MGGGSAFDGGMSGELAALRTEICTLYKDDAVPWVIGYSGGKDSTAILQLVWRALEKLPAAERTKPVHVISTDTLVENPVVAAWVSGSLKKIGDAAREQGLPIQSHRLTPPVEDTFWVNLIGRGYPAPRNKFRWCTNRLKIQPSNNFIRDVVRENGEAILVLGTRRAESQARARNMAKHAENAVRDRLSPNVTLPNCLIYTPIERWANDDVWAFLTREGNPWGQDNHALMGMYRGASEDGECPLVVDKTTPSCGNSRFGCYVCTLVDQDRSMAAMIQNDAEKEWMEPLLALRDELDFRGDEKRATEKKNRDYRRLSGNLTLYHPGDSDESQLVRGPYTQEARANWLRRVLETQQIVREIGPPAVAETELLTLPELQEIRRLWVVEKHEIEDLVPQIYEEAIGEAYPGPPIDEDLVFDAEALAMLREESQPGVGGDDPAVPAAGPLTFELARNLLDVERRFRTKANRRGLYKALEKTVEKCFYDGEDDALDRARQRSGEDEQEPPKKELVQISLLQPINDAEQNAEAVDAD